MSENKWLDWAVELQSLAQAGLKYTNDVFDRERFERIREISAENLKKITKPRALIISALMNCRRLQRKKSIKSKFKCALMHIMTIIGKPCWIDL